MRIVPSPLSPRIAGRVPLVTRWAPEIVTLTVLLLGAAIALAIAVLFPMSERAPVGLGWAFLVIAVAMAAGTLLLADRLPRGVLLGEAAAAVALNSVLVAAAQTTAGAIIDAFAYVWFVAYVALFFPRFALPFVAFTATTFGAALLAGDLPHMSAPWAVVTVGLAALASVVSLVSSVGRRHAATDILTGSLNRAGLLAAAERASVRARHSRQDVAIAVLDLDAFKAVNDAGGHAAGDALLSEAADAWQRVLRRDDILGRLGGDEFVLVMPGTSQDEAQQVLERLRRAHGVAWSAGVTRWQPEEPVEQALHRADEALYSAKRERSTCAADRRRVAATRR